ncbi:MAG: precorrin-2 C(20)-methyltransferase [Clostridiales bacterium]
MKNGKLYGVSVGPGDPELLTLKAKRLIEACGVIATPQTSGEKTLALDIVMGIVDLSHKQILRLPFMMTRDEEQLRVSHEEQAKQICAYLKRGEDVALLNLGDVSVYSTYSYMNDLVLAAGYETEMIPGVTSFCAIAAILGQSLTVMKKPLHIIPAGYGKLSEYLQLPGTKVIMKTGKNLTEVKDTLSKLDLLDCASLVADCGLPGQKVYPSIKDAGNDEGYFATIIVKERQNGF